MSNASFTHARSRSTASSRAAISAISSVFLAMPTTIPRACDRNARGPSTTATRKRATALAVVPVAAATLLLTGCSSDNGTDGAGGADSAPESTTTALAAEPAPVSLLFEYTAELGDNSGINRDRDEEGAPCGINGLTSPSDNLAFMDPFGDVVLLDAGGEIVAKAPLSNGSMLSLPNDGNFGWRCGWTAEFDDVPDSDFYTVEVNGEEVETLEVGEDLLEMDGELFARIEL